MLLLFRCSSTRFLKENEYILYENVVKNAPKEEADALSEQIKQKSNRRVLGALLYVKIYNMGKVMYDTNEIRTEINLINRHFGRKTDSLRLKEKFKSTPRGERKKTRYLAKIEKKQTRKLEARNEALEKGNFLMRSAGEPPVIYDSSLTERTRINFYRYLLTKGYFKASVIAQTDTSFKKKRIKVTYLINQGVRYHMDSLHYKIQDPKVDSLIVNSYKESKIQKGDPFDESKISEERERIYALLKNEGYFDFVRQQLSFEVDSLDNKNPVILTMIIGEQHKVYRLSKLFFNQDLSIYNQSKKRDTALYKNVYYTYTKKTYLRKLLDHKIATRPRDVYSYQRIQRTQQMLGALDLYKFVNINYEKDKSDSSGTGLLCYINTSPMAKFQLSQEYGVSVGQAYVPGPFFQISLKTRNIFRSLEVWETSARYSLDAQASVTDQDNNKAYRTQEVSIQTSLTLPQLLFQTRLRDVLRDYNPRLKFQLGYTNIIRPEYKRQNFRAGFVYYFQKNIFEHWTFTPIDINIIGSEVDNDFNNFLETLRAKGSNLYLSFRPSIVTGASISYVYNNHDATSNKKSKYFRPTLEVGGVIPNIVSQNFAPSEQADSNKLFNKQYFEFFRISTDARYYFPVGKKNTFAIRLNAGYAQPFASSKKADLFALPYEKYFFAGGNSSIRAWRPRRLGPGTYLDSGYVYEQPGEILFETNYEYRFNVISFVDGALFVDAGNVWTIKDATRPGSQFKFFNSFRDIAVGGGFGIRFDFSFLIVRFDLANKIWDPGLVKSDRLAKEFDIRDSALNIGIGYPF
jgi:outer membrane translocation and assembly module TamA